MYKYTCQRCGAKFESKNSPGCKRVPKYCSHPCYAKSKIGKPFPYDGPRVKPWKDVELVKCVCKICGTSFEVWPSRAKKCPPKYCSRECQHESKRRVTGPDHPLWTRIQRLCEWCGKAVWVIPAKLDEFRFCSRSCMGSYTSKRMADWKGPTSIEQLLMDELDRRHISYEPQYRIGHRVVDIALLEPRIVIEADGDYWHSFPEQQRKDQAKTRWLEAHSWIVHRFSGTEIRTSPVACIDQVVESLGLTRLQTHFLELFDDTN